MLKGRKEGLEEGREAGRKEGEIEVGLRLIERGMGAEEAAELEVEDLQKRITEGG